MEQFPPLEAFDESPRPRLVIVITFCVIFSREVTVGAAEASGTVTQEALGSAIATAAAAASTKDEEVVATDGSTRPARLAEDELLLFPVAAMAAACRLRKLFDCGDCDTGDCGEFAHDELILEMDCGRSLRCAFTCCGSRWRVRMMDNFRRMMFPSGITLVALTCGCD